MILKNFLLFSIPAIMLSGCGSMGHKLDSAKTKAVRKVAIISFEVQQQQPADNLGLGALKQMTSNGPRPGDSPEAKAMAASILESFNNELARVTRWKVAAASEVRAQRAYEQKYKKAMEGARQISIMSGNSEVIFADGILDSAAFRKMKYAEQVQLAKQLGVDAFAELVILQNIHQGFGLGNISGDGPFTYSARSNLRVFALDSEEPIWQIQNVDGEETGSSVDLGNLPKAGRIAKLGERASLSSLKKLAADFNSGGK